MHGAAVTLAKQFLADWDFQPDLVLADDMLDLATFIALTRKRLANVPFALYMHENQLLYPLAADKKKGPMRRNWGLRERQYVLINWKSMLAADHIFFNSHFHQKALFDELPLFLRHYQDHNEEESVELLRAKSTVLPVGIDFHEIDRLKSNELPTILWNQRWEFDKNPAEFFATLRQFKQDGGRFKLIICGESFSKAPDEFSVAKEAFKSELIHFGYATRSEYNQLLAQSDIVISTALHEFFGISILEAIHAGAFPLLPNRLSYPELIPTLYHQDVLYSNRYELVQKLHTVTADLNRYQSITHDLRSKSLTYSWNRLIRQYDQEIEALIHIS